jgi:hypothetical protein
MMGNPWVRVQSWVFIILIGSYAFFWHSRDWNGASRLMLTYALVDRGTVCLDGLDRQTGDIAHFRGRYYCDKLPGFSFLAAIPYGLARWSLRLPPHPLNVPAKDYWPADYWVTLATSGLFTAWTAVLLARLARDLGCSPRAAALVGLAYGLATPAYVYATLPYGHQVSAFALLGSFGLLWQRGKGRDGLRLAAAGFLAAYAAVIELQVGPVSAILGLYLLAQCLAGRRRPDALAYFGIGAVIPTLLLLGYNLLAFGSPWDMGYFHHATMIFAKVHNRQNPLGLQPPRWGLLGPLLWGRYRGLLFYAPILCLALPGWWLLFRRGRAGLAVVSLLVVTAVFLVNLSYPEWTGGWSTGPRLLVPLLPFAMIPVSALLGEAGNPTWRRIAAGLAVLLAFAGAVLMLMVQGVGARIPQDVADPFFDVVLPLWRGQSPLPSWWTGERFASNLVTLWAGEQLERLPVARELASVWVGKPLEKLPTSWLALQFVPLVLAQALGMLAIARSEPRPGPTDVAPS